MGMPGIACDLSGVFLHSCMPEQKVEKIVKENKILRKGRLLMKRFSRFAITLGALFLFVSLGGGTSGVAGYAGSMESAAAERISSAPVPARIAFTRNQQLWVLDAADGKTAPKQVTTSGKAELIGWSHDGEYLMYTRQEQLDSSSGPKFLWIVKGDGSNPQLVDPRPIWGRAKWSPKERAIAYLTGDSQVRKGFSIAAIGPNEQIEIRQLSTGSEIADIAWMPDGKSLIVSMPAAKDRPIQLAKIDLKTGKTTDTNRLGDPPKIEQGIYPYLADGLTISPDGRYVAYFELVNSASISADGVPIKLFDLFSSTGPKTLGVGLAYPEWLAWSPDSKRLAFVAGAGREATANKQINVIDPATGSKLFDSKEKGKVDTEPVWSQGMNSTLYFVRGKENRDWLGNYDPGRLLVPEQRIWAYSGTGKPVPVTFDKAKTADLYPNPSPDNNDLLYLRLDGAEHGSLYRKKRGALAEQVLIRDITGEPGYYGNYLPEWVKVSWEAAK